MKRMFATLAAGALFSGLTLMAEDSAKQDMKNAGTDVKQAGKASGHAVKNASKGVAKGAKKGVNKSARATENGAEKVKEKTQ